jgi:biopolymer transport protein ExbD
MPLKGKSPEESADINVTPLCDVMLVLLIIFMVITPMLQKNVSVDMVKTQHAQEMDAENKTNAVTLAVTRDGRVYLGRKLIPMDSVTSQVTAAISHNIDKTVFLRADARAKYGDVLDVVNALRAANIQDLGMLTEQVQQGPPGAPPTATP